jgi:hypothetical protein
MFIRLKGATKEAEVTLNSDQIEAVQPSNGGSLVIMVSGNSYETTETPRMVRKYLGGVAED